jgi:hypothetical protein
VNELPDGCLPGRHGGGLGSPQPRPPMRLCAFPVPPAELRGWAEYLWPAGPATVLRGGTDTSRMLVGEQVIV